MRKSFSAVLTYPDAYLSRWLFIRVWWYNYFATNFRRELVYSLPVHYFATSFGTEIVYFSTSVYKKEIVYFATQGYVKEIVYFATRVYIESPKTL